MKPRSRHETVTTSYVFWGFPDARPQYQYFCECGEVCSGFLTELEALNAAASHRIKFPAPTAAPVPA